MFDLVVAREVEYGFELVAVAILVLTRKPAMLPDQFITELPAPLPLHRQDKILDIQQLLGVFLAIADDPITPRNRRHDFR